MTCLAPLTWTGGAGNWGFGLGSLWTSKRSIPCAFREVGTKLGNWGLTDGIRGRLEAMEAGPRT